MSHKTQTGKKRFSQDRHSELYRSKQRFRDIAEVASDWFWETDSELRFTYISDRFYQVSSISPKEVIGKTRLEFISDNEVKTNPKIWKDHENDLLNRRPFRNFEYQVHTPDGKPCYIRISGKPFFSEDGIFLGYRGAGSDTTAQKVAEKALQDAKINLENQVRIRTSKLRQEIAERKQAEQALRKSEDLLSSIYRAAPTGIGVVSNRILLTVNDRICEMTGYNQESLIGKSARILYPSDADFEYVGKEKYRQISDRGTGTVETRWQRRDGQLIDVLMSSTPINPRDLAAGVTFTALDITERKQAEEALRQSRERLHRIVNNAVVGIYQVTQEGKFLLVNRRLAQMFGYTSPEEFYASVDNIDQLYLDPKERPSILEEINIRGFVDDAEIQFWNRNGKVILVRASVRVIQDEKKGPIYEGVMADITEQKRAERALWAREEKLSRSKKMESLGLLAGGVAHDLNNILSGVIAYPELLLMDLPPDSKLREPIEVIQDSGHRAVAIVQDLLTVARGVAIAKEPLNLNEVVADYLYSPEFKKLEQFHPTVSFQTDLDSELVSINGSSVHIRKIVMNLVSNATEASAGGGQITISTVNRYMDRPLGGYDDVTVGEYVVLAVSDDGSGIAAEDLQRIFEPFYTKKVMGRSGTGLGLAVVWNTVQDHKGYIDVRSGENGTTFELYFPMTRDEIAEKNLSVPIDDYQGNGETILVVDDIESQRDITCRMLDTLGYQTKVACSGEEAVAYLKNNRVDLLLLDMIMDPGMNGRETYEQIIKIHPNQKAIIISGFAETDEVKKTQKLGAGKYVKKPFGLVKIGIAIKAELAT